MRVPAAQMPTMGVPPVNNEDKVSPRFAKEMSTSVVRLAMPYSFASGKAVMMRRARRILCCPKITIATCVIVCAQTS